MKKILSAVLLTSLLSVNLASFATETSQVKLNLTNVPLKSALQNKYSAYRIEYFNEGQNPVRVNDVRCYNKVGMADISGSFYTMNKHDVMMYALSPLTLGITGLIAGSKATKQSCQMYPTMDEAKRYNAYALGDVMSSADSSALKTSNEILSQGQSVQFNVLVPLNETPEAVATMEDITTHKYIRVESSK